MKNIIKITNTCYMSPSQWEGILDDGHMVYFRYRWGRLTITESFAPTNNIKDAVLGNELYSIVLGDHLDGYISYEELKKQCEDLYVFPEECDYNGL
jgi:hypothetical protein